MCPAQSPSENSRGKFCAAGVRLAIFDVDGVLTNGQLILGPNGEEFKAFNVRDGQGLVMLREAGIELAVITGRRSEVVEQRMQALGVEYLYQGQANKMAAFESLLAKTGVEAAHCAYLGDDLPDIPVMRAVGFAAAVADADPRVARVAVWQTTLAGGSGAAREFAEYLLSAQNKLAQALHKYGAQV